MRAYGIHFLAFAVFAGVCLAIATATARIVETDLLTAEQLAGHITTQLLLLLLVGACCWFGAAFLAQRAGGGRAAHGVKGQRGKGQQPLINTLSDTLGELDDTRRKLLASERLAAMGYFAGGVAHQIGNPLSAARQYMEVLTAQAGQGGTPDPETIDKIRRQLDRIHRAIEGLSRFARPDRLRPEPIELAPFLAEVVAEVEAAWQGPVDLSLDIADGLVVDSDRLALEQAVINFVRNGLEAQDDAVCRIHLRAVAAAGGIHLIIQDEGPGFPQGFSPDALLESEKLGGTGLGVPIAVRLVELLGGEVVFGNGPTGAEVEIILPLQ